MSIPSQEKILSDLVAALRAADSLPRNIEMSTIGSVHMATAFDDPGSEIISESVSVGMDSSSGLAAVKALVEFVERRAFMEGARQGHRACLTERSDGFAAFPTSINNAGASARENAYSEAVERYVWSRWWDDEDIGHRSTIVSSDRGGIVPVLLSNLSALVPLRECYQIVPEVLGGPYVSIFFAFINEVGVVSGGACSSGVDPESANMRAVCELARHALAVRRMSEKNISPKTFYEKRLAYFGLDQRGEIAARNRLEKKGTKAIALPSLSVDEEIPHSLSQAAVVHRCLFENQPAFVGGALERLCL